MPKNVIILLILLASSCASHHQSHTSWLDSQYRYQKQFSHGAPSSGSISIYQSIISSILGTDCPMFPSCSRYAAMTAMNCGETKATFLVMARMINERDAAKMKLPIIRHHRKVLYEDLPPRCNCTP